MKKNIELLADESLSEKLVKKGFRLYFFGYLAAPIGYLVRLIISNSPNVSVADFGVMYSIISLVTFLGTYNDLGLTESLRFFLPRFYLKKEYNNIKTTIRLSLGTQLFTSFIIAACLRFGNEWLSVHYFKNEHAGIILKYFCIYFALTNILQVFQSIFISFQKTFESQFTSFIQLSTTLIFIIFCFFSGRGNIEWYSIGWILGYVVGIIVAYFLYRKYHKTLMQGIFKIEKEVIGKYVKYALWAFVGSSIGTLLGQIIQQMTLYFLGAENAGYYSNFLSLFNIGSMLIGPIIGLMFPIVSELFEKKDNKKLGLLYSFFYNYFSIFILSLSTLFIVLGPEISIALFGKQYLTSGILLAHSGIFLLFSLLSSFNYNVLAGMGKVKERVCITGISCVLTIISTYILIKLCGIYGAGIAFGISYIYTRGGSLFLLNKEKYSLRFDWMFIIKNILIFIILGVIIYFRKVRFIDIDGNRWYMIARLVIIGLAFYGMIGLENIGIIKRLRKKKFLNLRK